MRARSWMAASALIVGISITVGFELLAQDRSPTDQTLQSRPPKPADPPSVAGTRSKPSDSRARTAKLNLVIAGLGRDGCEVEIKPGNPSCKFRALNENGTESRQHVTSKGQATLDLLDIELRGADRTCSIAITVHEPGQAAKTIYRGFRLPTRPEGPGTPAAKTVSIPSFTCYLSSPSKLTIVGDRDPGTSTRK
jgi:hypothetical protein